ncbi:hypothetical protein [Lacticaseibacillus saniviri]|uniref:hypothetical protein n=1 Tax=Lacticaseibacillus saniviri TaxID=931533 RepID=UPI0006D2B4FA|nr:hypothetical protein [Lacticaseibacillus saniviri]
MKISPDNFSVLTPFISKNWGVGRRLVSEWQVSSEYKALVQGFSQCTNGSLEKFREVVSNQYVLDATLERLIFVKPNATGTLDDVDYLMGLFDAALISLERSMFMIEASEASASFQKILLLSNCGECFSWLSEWRRKVTWFTTGKVACGFMLIRYYHG